MRSSYGWKVWVWVSMMGMLLAACSTSSDVVADGWLQKRKHRKGFHIDLKHDRRVHHEDVAQQTPSLPRPDPVSPEVLEDTNAHPSRTGSVQKRKWLAWGPSDPANDRASKLDPPSYQDPKPKRKNLEEEADERTEELEALQEARVLNKRRLLISGIITAAAIGIIILTLVISGLLPPAGIVLASGLLSYASLQVLPYTIPLFLIYLIERGRLNKGELYFTDRRIENLSTWVKSLKLIQLILFAGLVLIALSIYTTLFELYPLAILLIFIGLIVWGFFNIISYLGTLLALLLLPFEVGAGKSLAQLIALRVITFLLAAIVLLLILFVITGLLI